MALLLALSEANAAKESLGLVLSAVHVHHGLRAAEADGDEAFVRSLCERLGIPLHIEHVDTAARQVMEGEGVEEAARELRYAVFRGLLDGGQVDAVATAHTLDDQAETVVMKLLRGAWTDGLGGIQPVFAAVSERGGTCGDTGSRAHPGQRQATAGRIVRPLLGTRRAEVERYLQERNQAWREDSSNTDTRLTRNRIRHELMPVLRSFNPGIDELLGRTAIIAQDEETYWQGEISRLLPALLLPGKPVRGGGRAVSTGVGERSCALELDRLRGLPTAVQRRVVRGAAATLGSRLSSVETAKLMALAGLETFPGLTGRIGAKLELAGELRAERSARELRMSRNGTPVPPKV